MYFKQVTGLKVISDLIIVFQKLSLFKVSYYGKINRHMKFWVSEQQGVSPREGKQVRGTLSTSFRDHVVA